MNLEEALQQFADGQIEADAYAEVWLDELEFCYAKHGGAVSHFIHFVEPCHWSFGVMQPTGESFGQSRGSITIPALSMHPEWAARALIAYEQVTVTPVDISGL